MLIQGQVGPQGPQSTQPGTTPAVRLGQLNDVIVSELHGRFYEQTYRGGVFRFGTGNTQVLTGATNTISTATSATLATAATGLPLLGIWNPPTSTVNVVLLQASLQFNPTTFSTPQPPGMLISAASVGNFGITAANIVPFNSKTLTNTGSQVKGFDGRAALTGLSTPLTAIEPLDLNNAGTLVYGTLAGTTSTYPSIGGVQNFDGQIIIPPGSVWGIFTTVTTTTYQYTGRLLWEEVPL
jgi:hypothetical protein